MIPLPFTLLFWVRVYTPFLCLLSREDPLAFVGELVWWCWILSAFACLESFWFLLHIWMRSLLSTVIWAVGYFLFHFQYVLPFPPGLKSFYWKINCYPYGNPLVCYLLFSLAAFNICSLCLIFVKLINMCLGVFCLGFILFGTLWVSWTWIAISFLILGKFSTIISSIFSWPFFLSSSSGTPMIRMFGCLTLSQRSLRLSSFLLILFLFSSLLHLFPPFYLPPHLSYLLP